MPTLMHGGPQREQDECAWHGGRCETASTRSLLIDRQTATRSLAPPALYGAYPVAHAFVRAPEWKTGAILVSLSGRGDAGMD